MRDKFTDPAEESEGKDPRRTGPRVVKPTEPQASFERSPGPKPGPAAKRPPATAAATNSMPTNNRPLPRNTVAKNLSSRPPIRPGRIADVLIEHVWAVPLRAAIAKAGGVAVSDEWVHLAGGSVPGHYRRLTA